MTLRARRNRAKLTGAERSSACVQQQSPVSRRERPASQGEAIGKDNLWTFLRHGPTSWAAVARALVVLLVLAAIMAGIMLLLWACGFALDFGVGRVGPPA